MANIKSAQKQDRQNKVKRARNLARRTSVKSAVKKVLTSIEKSDSFEMIQKLLQEAESKVARATGKGVIKKNTARRKIGRLAKKVAALKKEQPSSPKKK